MITRYDNTTKVADVTVGHLGDIATDTSIDPYRVSTRFTRAGNIVTVEMTGNLAQTINVGDIHLNETIPAGFRPAYQTGWVPIQAIGTNPAIFGNLAFYPDGRMWTQRSTVLPAKNNVMIRTTYVTRDAWPN